MGSMVQHNIVAMNANRNLNVTTAAQAKSTEKLSTGYKINRAADDAAGLSISEKMRRQVRGLTQASSNAQDGISSVQTAEGALTEVHDMLQRMDELATKASNGSLSEDDRQNVQDEIDSLLTEIDRVSETTKFNETFLLKGDPTTDNIKTMNLKAHDAGLKGDLETNSSGKIATFTMDALTEGQKIKIGGTEYTISEAVDADYSSTDATASKNGMVVSGGTTLNGAATSAALQALNGTTDGDEAVLTFKTVDEDSVAADGWYDAAGNAATLSTFGLDDGGKAESGDTITITSKVDTVYSGNTTKTDGGAASGLVAADFDFSGFQQKGTNGSDANTGQDVVLTYNGSGWDVTVDGTAKPDLSITTFGISDASSPSHTPRVGDKISWTVATPAPTPTVTAAAAMAVTGTLDQDKANEIAASNAGNDVVLTFDGTNWSDGGSNSFTAATLASDLGLTATGAQKGDTITFSGITVATEGKDATATYKDANPGRVGENIISRNDAYKLIRSELEVANNIGATTKASVGAKTDTTATDANGNTVKKAQFEITLGSIEVQKSLKFQLHVGSDADMTNKIGVNIESMDSKYLGIKDLDVVGEGNDGGKAATYAIDAIEDAIKKVSEQRSALGAVQNRLEHTVKNLNNVVENTSSAESQIRDTDMATEMVTYSKNNILAQAGQSMLAQANQSNQGVLSLLG